MKRGRFITLALVLLAAVIVGAANTAATKRPTADEASRGEEITGERWEYLVVAGANNNLTASGNPNLRKDTSGGFSREAFVLEQALDKVGAKGWELVSVTGPGEPVYYFKRRK
jgi:hypothetical protein